MWVSGCPPRLMSVGLWPPTASRAASAPRARAEKAFFRPSAVSVVAARSLSPLRKALAFGAKNAGPFTRTKSCVLVALGTRQVIAFHAKHLDREPARRRHLVVENIARIGREPHHDGMVARLRKGALGEDRRQIVEHRQRTTQDPMALGMDAAHRVTVILEGGLGDGPHGVHDRLRGLGLVRLRLLDTVPVADRLKGRVRHAGPRSLRFGPSSNGGHRIRFRSRFRGPFHRFSRAAMEPRAVQARNARLRASV